jgi:hypothetical protein
LAQAREKKSTESAEKSSEDTNPGTYHIVDIADHYMGKSLIITGISTGGPTPRKLFGPEGEKAPREDMETATEKPPEP